jgi:hypothetical protein
MFFPIIVPNTISPRDRAGSGSGSKDTQKGKTPAGKASEDSSNIIIYPVNNNTDILILSDTQHDNSDNLKIIILDEFE